tara:strand:+ start:665 stop:1039 length:375 start_codon:yes stop_codon:yes gene_type:complete
MNIKRKTKSVELLLNTFKDLSAISIIDLVEKFKNDMDKTTVYRILDRLEKSNILHSFIDNEGLKRYAKNKVGKSQSANQHPHFLCEECGVSSCIAIEMKIPALPSYKIKDSEHLLIGQCKKCLA